MYRNYVWSPNNYVFYKQWSTQSARLSKHRFLSYHPHARLLAICAIHVCNCYACRVVDGSVATRVFLFASIAWGLSPMNLYHAAKLESNRLRCRICLYTPCRIQMDSADWLGYKVYMGFAWIGIQSTMPDDACDSYCYFHDCYESSCYCFCCFLLTTHRYY